MNNRYRNETNDLRGGAEFDCRHGVDQDWAPVAFHMHPHYEFYLLIRGNVQMLIEDESFDAHPMDLFVFPPGVLHRALLIDSSVPYERAYCYVTRKALDDMSGDGFPVLRILEAAADRGFYSYHADSESAGRFLRLLDDWIADAGSDDPSAAPMNRCRINMMALTACRIVQHRDVLVPRPPDRMSEIIRHINDHLLEPLTLESLSEQFYISKYTLLHDFKSYVNISVHQYILYKRVLHAQELMRNGTPPGNAARQSGFNDYAGFYRAFVRYISVPPQTWYAGVKSAEKGGFSI
jgi:AraC-like DNA-binding protein